MKKIISSVLAMIMLLSMSMTVFANGDPNLDGGGGGMGGGTSTNTWTPGRDGVRVTVIRDSDSVAVTSPIDFSDETNSDVRIHFGKVSKMQYLNGVGLSAQMNGYSSVQPASTMPVIVSSSGNNNISAIREYFCREGTIRDIANITGFNYDLLISGDYKVLIEPMAYFKFESIMYAMTATEAAKLNQSNNNLLRRKMVSLSHKNLPLAMFLENSDLGLPAYGGATSSAQSDQTIISSLGMGIIRFTELPPPEPQTSDVTYRADTDVITSVTLTTSSEKNPDSPAYASFSINGRTYSHSNIYIPEDGSQLAWVKWRTPPEEGQITITITSNCNVSTNTIVAEIVDLDKNPPPDPQANDRNDSFRVPSTPTTSNVTNLSWGEWDAWWYEYWVDNGHWESDSWTDSEGNSHSSSYWVSNWEDEGWYEFDWISYNASLTANINIKPDEKSPTASSSQMKSGYGFNMDVSSSVRSNAPTSHYTGLQNVVAYFPEFEYQTYWRLLARKSTGYNATFEFKNNKYSTYNQKVHFTPIWYPDGTYKTYTEALDAWTPAGMMSIHLTDTLSIRDSLYDDWHIRPIK